MSLSHEINIPITLGDGTTPFELLLYAPNSAQISLESAVLIPENSATLQAVNFTNLQILDKGSDGTGTDEIASLSTEDVAGNNALTANVKSSISPSNPYSLSNAITIKKTDPGTAVDLGDCILVLKVREK